MRESSVELDFFTHRRLIFADSLCNGGLGGTVGDAGKNDTAFL